MLWRLAGLAALSLSAGCSPATRATAETAPSPRTAQAAPGSSMPAPAGTATPPAAVAPRASASAADPARCTGGRDRVEGDCVCPAQQAWRGDLSRCRRVRASGPPKCSPDGAAYPAVPGACPVIQRGWPKLTACYDQLVDDRPGLQGSARLVAKLAPDGTVAKVVVSGGGGLDAIHDCLRAALSELVFAPPEGGGAVITIPITFVAQ